jgi:hypothetical protein
MVLKTLFRKYTTQKKKGGEGPQGEGPELKPQYNQKKKVINLESIIYSRQIRD